MEKMKKKKTIHELCKEYPNTTYAELEKYRKTEEILLKQENEELKEKMGIKKNINPMDPGVKSNTPVSYRLFYWGPMLFKINLPADDLKKFATICTKKESFVNEKLAGVIKHEHYISPQKFYEAIKPHLVSFRHSYNQWYGKPLTHRIMIDIAWANFMVAGESNPPHIHANCDFSSVLFVKIPDKLKEENKKFLGQGSGPGSISFSYGEYQKYAMHNKGFFPEEGDLFIFPATLTHFVAPFRCKEERISISANFKLE